MNMAVEAEEIYSENWMFEYKLDEYNNSIPSLISRRQSVSGFQEKIRSSMAEM